MHEIPRRAYIDRLVPAELKIREAILAVEEMGADVRLTDVVVRLGAAKDLLSDFVDGVAAAPAPQPEDLAIALEESVKLQSHYAGLLNQHDGGQRFQFSVKDWLERLRILGKLAVAPAPQPYFDRINDNHRVWVVEQYDDFAAEWMPSTRVSLNPEASEARAAGMNRAIRRETAMTDRRVMIELSGREVAILAAVLNRCRGWDDPRELARFLSTAADCVRDGFTDAEMEALAEKLAGAWSEGKRP